MGTFFSQFQFNELFDEDITHESGPRPRPTDGRTTPNKTPTPRVLECDPRSPTDGITRTPIEVLSVSLPKGRQATYESRHSHLPYEHTPCIVCEPKHKFSWMDPRSPAVGLGFTRTPIRFDDVSDSTEDTDLEDIEQVLHMPLVVASSEEYHDVSHNAEGIEDVSGDVALVHEPTEEDRDGASHTTEDIEHVFDVPFVTAKSTEDRDASRTAEDIDQISRVPPTTKSPEDNRRDASQAVTCVDQESHEALVADSAGKHLVQVVSAKQEGIHQEISQATDVSCKSSAGKHTSEVTTPVRHTVKIDSMPPLRIDDLKKGVLNTRINTPDTPKSIDKAKCFVVDKENCSSIKKQVFHTPETKAEDGAKPKVRTPLGAVCGNNSPMQMLRDKQSNIVKKSLSSRPPQFTQFNRTTVHRP